MQQRKLVLVLSQQLSRVPRRQSALQVRQQVTQLDRIKQHASKQSVKHCPAVSPRQNPLALRPLIRTLRLARRVKHSSTRSVLRVVSRSLHLVDHPPAVVPLLLVLQPQLQPLLVAVAAVAVHPQVLGVRLRRSLSCVVQVAQSSVESKR